MENTETNIENKEEVSQDKNDLQSRVEEYLKLRGKIVKKTGIELVDFPVFVPTEDGKLTISLERRIIDKRAPVPSPILIP